MAHNQLKYRKNFGLLIAFVVLVTVLFVVAMLAARSMIANFIETEFNNRKVEIFDQSVQPFNEFFNDKIPEISYYQGYLDSVKAAAYVNDVIRKNAFVESVLFYDLAVTNSDSIESGIKYNHLLIYPKSVISFSLDAENRLVAQRKKSNETRAYVEDFNNMVLKFVGFLDRVNDSTRMSDNDIYKVFYTMSAGKVSYMNIPRISDLLAYKRMMSSADSVIVSYDQDMFLFLINPGKIKIKNVASNLYEKVEILPIVSGQVTDQQFYLQTELALPGALSDYKLQYTSSEGFINKEINRRFLPTSFGLSVVYLILMFIAYLIYRNITINSRLFQLQYDFINNLTHEFKTPVSVIKIAGNNIQSSEKLSVDEQRMYGKILDQEADKLNSLMNKLLSFAQIENKSIKPNKEEVVVEEFCAPIFEAVKLKYPDLNFSYHIDVQNNMIVDSTLLLSVFQNLIDNAYKYSEPQRKFLDIEVQQNKKNFVIKFKDQGIGINKKEFNSIFKKFYRVKNQFNQQGSIGLGLAFCKEIVDFMGGEIKVDSVVNQGTTFTLLLPLGPKKN
ncbi:two-component system phosphate regulon sensor histidine kinase PhoR [Sphingobacterium allocomposti]|uniref:histidine kinase n=1 Tax=Sphingobacterium allocomposti TaxID=415956 RepID=A0A5S5DN46_9SPHI|nr:HAMP domain-containing sensor histidine kinase [Sphingobacterium composti Yoo et al. 2007 non Ten et al. 2007]TYP96109.1 two-component system phosphate regulon sensor histidine kinase PhoR [Sphingobacterium composti Yoo et al. 2007 non Ten et al. 2007]